MSFFHRIPSITMLLYLFILLQTHLIFCDQLIDINCSRTLYRNGSAVRSNLDELLSELPSAASRTGFFNTSVGENHDRIYGLAICLAGIKSLSCQNCLESAVKILTNNCSYKTSAVSWYDLCMVHYTRKYFYDIPSNSSRTVKRWGDHEASGSGLETTVNNLITNLSNSAATNPTTRYAVGQVSYLLNSSNNITIYGLAQCTRDLSANNCSSCLSNYTATLVSGGSTYTGGRMVGESCFIWYDQKPINIPAEQNSENGTSPLGGHNNSTSASDSNQPSVDPEKSRKNIIIATAVGGVAGLLVMITCAWLCNRFRRSSSSFSTKDSKIRTYSMKDLKTATGNFSPLKRLGKGGYGDVYKATLGGESVAIKKLTKPTMQNEEKLKTQLSLVSRIEHPNILKLLGYCFEEDQYIFVYELMPNGSLDGHLEAGPRQSLKWETRFEIINDIVNGLQHLHHRKKTIHADLKPANILLSEEMKAKIGDFDLVRILKTDETHQCSKDAGTPGYKAPEVAIPPHRFSWRSDIYSFGLIVLELVTGRSVRDFGRSESTAGQTLMDFAWNHWNEKRYTEMADAYLDVQVQKNMEQIIRCIHIGMLCIQHDDAKRPNISDIDKWLNSNDQLPPPSVPGFLPLLQDLPSPFEEKCTNNSICSSSDKDKKIGRLELITC